MIIKQGDNPFPKFPRGFNNTKDNIYEQRIKSELHQHPLEEEKIKKDTPSSDDNLVYNPKKARETMININRLNK